VDHLSTPACTVQRLVRIKKQGGDERDPEVTQVLIKFMMSERDADIAVEETADRLATVSPQQ